MGYCSSMTLKNAHWLYFLSTGVEYAVGYWDSLGIPTSIGASKHNDTGDFCTLAETLNAGQDKTV